MSFLRKDNPFNGQYAIPEYVLSEPKRFGTHTTKYTPRRTISPMDERVAPWRSGYAVPDYIHEEPIGRGVFRTKYLPRGTVSTLIPNQLEGLNGVDEDTNKLADQLTECFDMSSRDILITGAVAGGVVLLAFHGLRHLLGGR